MDLDAKRRESIQSKYREELLEHGWLEEEIDELLEDADLYSREGLSWPIYSIWSERCEMENLARIISCGQVTSLEQMEYFDRVIAQALGRVALNYIKRIKAENLTHPVNSEAALSLQRIHEILTDGELTNRQKVDHALDVYKLYPFIR